MLRPLLVLGLGSVLFVLGGCDGEHASSHDTGATPAIDSGNGDAASADGEGLPDGAQDAETPDARVGDMGAGDAAAIPDGSMDGAASDAARPGADGSMPVLTCDAPCPSGQRCCPVGVVARCVAEPPDGVCPLPDLTVNPERLSTDLSAGWEYFAEGDCAVSEGCVGAAGWRRLLRFSTETPNHGTGDMTLGAPGPSNPAFRRDECTDQFLFDGYADYALEAPDAGVVASGRKRAFCLMDTNRRTDAPDVPAAGRYTCEDQGISRGWSDVYHSALECQWIDVTDVAPGDYTLRVHVNPLRRVAEASYDDNEVAVPVALPEDSADGVTVACSTDAAGTARDCGWAVGGSFSCAPGASVAIGCGTGDCAASSCTGDPVMRLCRGDVPCTARDALGSGDDCASRIYCPAIDAVCPEEGRVTVLTGAYQAGDAHTCTVVLR